MDLHSKKLLVSILNYATSRKLKPSSFRTRQKTRKSVSRTPRSSYQCHSSSMLILKHIQPRSMSRSMETQQCTRDISPQVWLHGCQHWSTVHKASSHLRRRWCSWYFLATARRRTAQDQQHFSVEKLMVMTAEDVYRHQQATACFICSWAAFVGPRSFY